MSRIGIIREAVVAAGGEVSVYYADNSERIRLTLRSNEYDLWSAESIA